MDRLAEEIAREWPAGVSAAQAVSADVHHRASREWQHDRLSDGHRSVAPRSVRSDSIGAERAVDSAANRDLAADLATPLGPLTGLSLAEQRMVERYVLDLYSMLGEVQRVLRPGGKAVFVVGNSCVRGVFVRNARALGWIAGRLGFTLLSEIERPLPPNRRYLPPPEEPGVATLEKRMRTETVLTFSRD